MRIQSDSWLMVTRSYLQLHGFDVVGPGIVLPDGYVSLDHVKAARSMPSDRRALVALEWACEMGATVGEMLAWDRAQHGGSLTVDCEPEQ